MARESRQESKESVDGKVFDSKEEAIAHGKGGIWYVWEPGGNNTFPRDVAEVGIVMPVGRGGIAVTWSISFANHCGARWRLSGTYQQPTLHPSLHWVGMWHGWLTDGKLKSC